MEELLEVEKIIVKVLKSSNFKVISRDDTPEDEYEPDHISLYTIKDGYSPLALKINIYFDYDYATQEDNIICDYSVWNTINNGFSSIYLNDAEVPNNIALMIGDIAVSHIENATKEHITFYNDFFNSEYPNVIMEKILEDFKWNGKKYLSGEHTFRISESEVIEWAKKASDELKNKENFINWAAQIGAHDLLPKLAQDIFLF